jgi:hypothetical protein
MTNTIEQPIAPERRGGNSGGNKRSQAQRINPSYIDPSALSTDNSGLMISGCRFETRLARPHAVAVSSLRRLTLALGLLLSIVLLNLRGLLLTSNLTAG